MMITMTQLGPEMSGAMLTQPTMEWIGIILFLAFAVWSFHEWLQLKAEVAHLQAREKHLYGLAQKETARAVLAEARLRDRRD